MDYYVYNPKTGKQEKQSYTSPTPAAPPAAPIAPTVAEPAESRGGNLYGTTIDNADTMAVDDGRFDWNDIGVGGYSFLDELLFGIPTWLVKSVGGSENYKKLQNWRQENKLASDIGQTAGFLGGLVVPGGAVAGTVGKAVGLAGKGAKALGAAKTGAKLLKAADVTADIAKAIKTGQQITTGGKALKAATSAPGRAILAGLEQSLPTAAAAVGTGRRDLGGALQDIVGGAAIGGALGKAGEVLGKRNAAKLGALPGLEDYGTAISRSIEDAADSVVGKKIAGATGLSARDLIRNQTQFLGRKRGLAKIAMDGDQIARDISSSLDEFGIQSPQMAEKFYENMIKEYRNLGAKMDAKGVDLFPAIQDTINNPEVIAFIGQYGDEGEKLYKKFLREIPKDNYGAAKEYINKIKSAAIKTASTEGQDSTRIADAFSDSLDDVVAEFAAKESGDPLMLDKMKRGYQLAKNIEASIGRDKSGVLTRASGGSPTFEKAGAGMMLGALTGGAAGGWDMEDPDLVKNKLTQIIGGSLVGSAANRIIPKLYNKGAGIVARGAEKIITPELAQKAGAIGERLSPLVEKAGQGYARVAGKTIGKNPEQAVAQTESMVTPEAQEQAKQEVNLQHKDVILSRLREIYDAKYAGKYSFEDYAAEVARQTGDFDPKRTAAILFPDKAEREMYLDKYDTFMKMAEMRKSGGFEKAVGYGSKKGNWIGGPSADEHKAFLDYVDMVGALVKSTDADGIGIVSKSAQNQIEDRMNAIMSLDVPDQDKAAMLEQYLVEKGLPLDLFKRAGLYA